MQSSSQIVTTNKPAPSFLQARCPSCRPTNYVKALKVKVKHKVDHAAQENTGGCSLPLLGLEPLMSVTRGQSDARPTVTFPVAKYHCPLAGTNLYCLVPEGRMLTTCPGLHSTAGRLGFKLLIASPAPCHYATEPH